MTTNRKEIAMKSAEARYYSVCPFIETSGACSFRSRKKSTILSILLRSKLEIDSFPNKNFQTICRFLSVGRTYWVSCKTQAASCSAERQVNLVAPARQCQYFDNVINTSRTMEILSSINFLLQAKIISAGQQQLR